MSGKGNIDALTNDRSDRQQVMMDRWQQSIEQSRLSQQRVAASPGDTMAHKAEIQRKLRSGEIECQTCEGRRYVDQSDDSSVSFQTPTNISPEQSYGAVLSHENEHVRHNAADAKAEGREVTHSSVSLSYAICPECGRSYVSGGLTRTVTQSVSGTQQQERKNPFASLDQRA